MSNLNIYSGVEGFDRFAEQVGFSSHERQARLSALSESFMPFKVTEYYAKLIASQEEPYKTHLINIVLPFAGDKPFLGRFDPYGNKNYRQDVRAFLQHKYEKTLLLHIDDYCISNCQFCYKVNEIRHEKVRPATVNDKINMALSYLDDNPFIDNVLFTGGDPASFRKTSDLLSLIDRLIAHKSIRVVRFATKGIAYDPERFLDEELLKYFSEINSSDSKQISIIAQINHPAEFSTLSSLAISKLQAAGVQIRGQPAIIRGVNDTVDTLMNLQRKFLQHKIISYYLTIFMPVRGVEQYSITLDQAFINVAESKRNLSGLEKKGVLLASHDFGKLEVCGFYPNPETPQKIVLKWHQVAMRKYLPKSLTERIMTRPEDILLLDYKKSSMYCIDQVFADNNLPYYDSDGQLVE